MQNEKKTRGFNSLGVTLGDTKGHTQLGATSCPIGVAIIVCVRFKPSARVPHAAHDAFAAVVAPRLGQLLYLATNGKADTAAAFAEISGILVGRILQTVIVWHGSPACATRSCTISTQINLGESIVIVDKALLAPQAILAQQTLLAIGHPAILQRHQLVDTLCTTCLATRLARLALLSRSGRLVVDGVCASGLHDWRWSGKCTNGAVWQSVSRAGPSGAGFTKTVKCLTVAELSGVAHFL